MIKLGVHDPEVTTSAIKGYFSKISKMLNAELDAPPQHLRGEQVGQFVPFSPLRNSAMKVAEVQRFLESAGFFRDAVIDGICGYRTQSAIRLFQEYTRVFHPETLRDYPDGQFGPNSTAAVRRWIEKGLTADWNKVSSAAPTEEFSRWLQLLARFKEESLVDPVPLLRKASARKGKSATIKPEAWSLEPNRIHLIGIRYDADRDRTTRTFDDLFVLLLNGLVFKFRGSTDPGATQNKAGAPFLVPGQHQYQFGWHSLSSSPNKAYHALRPLDPGVLIMRTNGSISEEAKKPSSVVENNHTINIHWGGAGRGPVKNWSEGCQVITGDGYINHHHSYIDCSPFSAPTNGVLGRRVGGVLKIKGAYSVLTDLVTALSGGSPDNRTVLYTLLYHHHLRLVPELTEIVSASSALLR